MVDCRSHVPARLHLLLQDRETRETPALDRAISYQRVAVELQTTALQRVDSTPPWGPWFVCSNCLFDCPDTQLQSFSRKASTSSQNEPQVVILGFNADKLKLFCLPLATPPIAACDAAVQSKHAYREAP